VRVSLDDLFFVIQGFPCLWHALALSGAGVRAAVHLRVAWPWRQAAIGCQTTMRRF
jgi:hypothetical protein